MNGVATHALHAQGSVYDSEMKGVEGSREPSIAGEEGKEDPCGKRNSWQGTGKGRSFKQRSRRHH